MTVHRDEIPLLPVQSSGPPGFRFEMLGEPRIWNVDRSGGSFHWPNHGEQHARPIEQNSKYSNWLLKILGLTSGRSHFGLSTPIFR